MGFKTLYDGETGNLISRSGEVKLIQGPRRVTKLNAIWLTSNYVK